MTAIYPLFKFFTFAAMALIPGGALFIVFLIAKSRKLPDKTAQDAFRKPAMTGFIVLFLFIWLGAVISRGTINGSRRKQFFDLEKRNFQSMVINKDGRTLEVTNPRDVAAFFQMMREAPTVGAHHSHPTSPFLITFPGFPETYSLGPDSANNNEFWFTLADGPDLRFGEKGATLMQLQSPQLNDWLSKLPTASVH